MRSVFLEFLFQLAAVTSVAYADVVYVTDLPNFSALAPCAASAVKYAVASLTYSKCPEAVTALESCACTKDNNGAALSSTISSDVLESCGATASEDVASASIVFDNYCNQDASATPFPAPENPVTVFVTDLPAYSDLAPCAASGISYAFNSLTYSKCPSEASALAPCACNKNQNSLLVSQYINTEVGDYCGSTMSEDISSAHAVFSGYCGLNNGTTDFPSKSELTAMTYYITDMQEYSSLAPCAKSAVYYEALYTLTNQLCPNGPGAVASCACIKGSNSGFVASALKSGVADYCSSTATEDVTSALGVFDFYCRAAKGEVDPEGITTSAVTTPYSNEPNGATKTGGTKTGSGKYTAPTPSKTGSSASGDTSSGKSAETKSKTPIGAIVGGAIGGVAVIFGILLGIWLYRRNHKKNQAPPATALPPGTDYPPPSYAGKSELASTSINPVLGPTSPGQRKPVPVPSPVPSHASVYPITQEKPNEMETPPPPSRSEVSGINGASPYQNPQQQYQHNTYEMQGRDPNQHYEMQNTPRNPHHEMDGMAPNMNSGPVYEMPGQHGWR